MKKRVLVLCLALTMMTGAVGCGSSESSGNDGSNLSSSSKQKTTLADYTQQENIDNISFYVPYNCKKKVEENIVTYDYADDGITFIQVICQELPSVNVSLHTDTAMNSLVSAFVRRFKLEETISSKIFIDDAEAILLEGKMNMEGITSYAEFFWVYTNKHMLNISISSTESFDDVKQKYNDFIKGFTVEDPKKNSKEQSIDNITYYIPKDSTIKYNKGSKVVYYPEDGFVMINTMDRMSGTEMHDDRYIDVIISNTDIKNCLSNKIYLNDVPGLLLEGTSDSAGYTMYVRWLWIPSDTHTVVFCFSSKMSKIKVQEMYNEFVQNMSIG